MGRSLGVRAVAVVSALLVASLFAFPSFPSAGLFSLAPAVAVDRTLKGDRLPSVVPTEKSGAPLARAREKIPVGCDRAFSPISSPQLADVFRRCTV
jgi:hypothetical protein